MEIFLRLKHWQLFSILMVFVIVSFTFKVQMFSNDLVDQRLVSRLATLVRECGFLVLMAWFYNVVLMLYDKMPSKTFNLLRFKYCLFYYLTFQLVYSIVLLGTWRASNIVIWLFGVVAWYCLFYTAYIAVKALRTVEGKPTETFKDIIVDFLSFIIPIGIFWLQPRINKIYSAN